MSVECDYLLQLPVTERRCLNKSQLCPAYEFAGRPVHVPLPCACRGSDREYAADRGLQVGLQARNRQEG